MDGIPKECQAAIFSVLGSNWDGPCMSGNLYNDLPAWTQAINAALNSTTGAVFVRRLGTDQPKSAINLEKFTSSLKGIKLPDMELCFDRGMARSRRSVPKAHVVLAPSRNEDFVAIIVPPLPLGLVAATQYFGVHRLDANTVQKHRLGLDWMRRIGELPFHHFIFQLPPPELLIQVERDAGMLTAGFWANATERSNLDFKCPSRTLALDPKPLECIIKKALPGMLNFGWHQHDPEHAASDSQQPHPDETCLVLGVHDELGVLGLHTQNLTFPGTVEQHLVMTVHKVLQDIRPLLLPRIQSDRQAPVQIKLHKVDIDNANMSKVFTFRSNGLQKAKESILKLLMLLKGRGTIHFPSNSHEAWTKSVAIWQLSCHEEDAALIEHQVASMEGLQQVSPDANITDVLGSTANDGVDDGGGAAEEAISLGDACDFRCPPRWVITIAVRPPPALADLFFSTDWENKEGVFAKAFARQRDASDSVDNVKGLDAAQVWCRLHAPYARAAQNALLSRRPLAFFDNTQEQNASVHMQGSLCFLDVSDKLEHALVVRNDEELRELTRKCGNEAPLVLARAGDTLQLERAAGAAGIDAIVFLDMHPGDSIDVPATARVHILDVLPLLPHHPQPWLRSRQIIVAGRHSSDGLDLSQTTLELPPPAGIVNGMAQELPDQDVLRKYFQDGEPPLSPEALLNETRSLRVLPITSLVTDIVECVICSFKPNSRPGVDVIYLVKAFRVSGMTTALRQLAAELTNQGLICGLSDTVNKDGLSIWARFAALRSKQLVVLLDEPSDHGTPEHFIKLAQEVVQALAAEMLSVRILLIYGHGKRPSRRLQRCYVVQPFTDLATLEHAARSVTLISPVSKKTMESFLAGARRHAYERHIALPGALSRLGERGELSATADKLFSEAESWEVSERNAVTLLAVLRIFGRKHADWKWPLFELEGRPFLSGTADSDDDGQLSWPTLSRALLDGPVTLRAQLLFPSFVLALMWLRTVGETADDVSAGQASASQPSEDDGFQLPCFQTKEFRRRERRRQKLLPEHTALNCLKISIDAVGRRGQQMFWRRVIGPDHPDGSSPLLTALNNPEALGSLFEMLPAGCMQKVPTAIAISKAYRKRVNTTSEDASEAVKWAQKALELASDRDAWSVLVKSSYVHALWMKSKSTPGKEHLEYAVNETIKLKAQIDTSEWQNFQQAIQSCLPGTPPKEFETQVEHLRITKGDNNGNGIPRQQQKQRLSESPEPLGGDRDWEKQLAYAIETVGVAT